MGLEGLHDAALRRPLSHDELVQLLSHCGASGWGRMARASLCNTLPGSGQHRYRVSWRRRVAGSKTWRSRSPPVVARQANARIRRKGGERCIWPRPRPRRTSGRWSSPPSSDGDIKQVNAIGSREPARVLPELLDQIPNDDEIGTVTADGACDTRRYHRAIIDRHPRPPGNRDHPDPQEPATVERGLPGRPGPAIGCAASRPSTTASPQETPTARPPKSRSASPSSTASQPPAPPRKFARSESNGQRASHAAAPSCATTPKCGTFHLLFHWLFWRSGSP